MALFQYHLTSFCTEFQLVQAAADSDTLGLPEMTFICTMTGQHLYTLLIDYHGGCATGTHHHPAAAAISARSLVCAGIVLSDRTMDFATQRDKEASAWCIGLRSLCYHSGVWPVSEPLVTASYCFSITRRT